MREQVEVSREEVAADLGVPPILIPTSCHKGRSLPCPPPTGNRQGEVDGRLFSELFAKFRPDPRHTVTFPLDPRLTHWIARCLPQIAHQKVIDREVPLLPHFESAGESIREHGGSIGSPPDPI